VSDIKNLIWSLVFGSGKSDTFQVKNVSRYTSDSTGCKLDFWHAIDVRDFSSTRGFVVAEPSASLFEVDFLSRHELISPMTEASLPPNWREWAVVRNGQILVTNRAMFCSQMLTADAFVALPVYRFGLFADDVFCSIGDGFVDPDDAIRRSLMSLSTGYSFVEYGQANGAIVTRFSILDAKVAFCYDGTNK
jgi:hypothetical protein